MLGKELRALLTPETDEMEVMLIVENHLKPGMFAFASACSCETGVMELGPGENGEPGGEKIFLVAPHGAGVSEEETEKGEDTIPELN